MSWNEHHHTALLTLISDLNSCIPQSRLCGRVLHMTYSTCTQGSFSKVFKFEYFSPCGDDSAPMQRPDKICLVSLVKWFRWIYHGARSTFTCSLNSAKSFQAPSNFKRSDSTELYSMKSCWKTMLHSAGNIFMLLMQCLKLNETHSEVDIKWNKE